MIANDLYFENQLLRRQLNELLAQARKNEHKLQRLQGHELRLIGTHSLFELIQRIVYSYHEASGPEWVTLALIDPNYEIQRILREQGVALEENPRLVFHSDEDALNRIYGISLTPKLGLYNAHRHAQLFPGTERAPESLALLPLIRNGELIGSLNLGSLHKERFTTDAGTDFLERLSAIAALCLENSLNHERLKRLGLTDPLTGVNNRRFFDQRLLEEVTRVYRHGTPLSCLMLDVDRFKSVNDNYGHPIGDQMLIEVGALIRAQLRGTDILARYGGEEFAALLAQTGEKEAAEIAERIRCAIEEHEFRSVGRSLRGTISIGSATLAETKGDIKPLCEQLVMWADRALYAAKEGGRNKTVAYTPPA